MVEQQIGDGTAFDPSNRWRASIFVAVIAALVFLPLFFAEVTVGTKGDSDFPSHVLYALALKTGKPVPAYILAHSGWQFLLLGWNTALGLSFQDAELISILLCVGLTAGILCWWFWPVLDRKKLPFWQAVLIVLGISLAAPIALYWFSDQELYLGYIGIISYHNPTIILLRPLALLQFIYVLRGFDAFPPSRAGIPAAALISLLATFTKPNFAICLLPAITLIALYRMIRKEAIHLAFLAFGFLVPMAVMLVWQFWMAYQGGDSAHVIFSVLGVMGAYSGYLLPKFLLSILFPLTVTLLYRKQAARNLPLISAWLIFLFGSFFTYFVAESGTRFKDGNFTWSGEIALFVLFAVSTLFFLGVQGSSRASKMTAQALWTLHIAAGAIYYVFFTLHILYLW
ncbi:MAG TPA: hypothetical protein VLZ89_13170 [Anaerolineales bacterium]|nr:hypothetical protein [Anaerolineales bacterium]